MKFDIKKKPQHHFYEQPPSKTLTKPNRRAEDLNEKNDEILMNEREELKTTGDWPHLWVRRLGSVEVSVPPHLIVRCHTAPSQNPSE